MRLEYFDMIDTVVAFEPAQKRIVTRSTVPGATETPVFEGHFPGHPLVIAYVKAALAAQQEKKG